MKNRRLAEVGGGEGGGDGGAGGDKDTDAGGKFFSSMRSLAF